MLVKNLTSKSFDSAIEQKQGLVMVDFGAPWCPPCRALVPVLEEIAAKYSNAVQLYTVNVDNEPELAAKYNIRGLPTVLVFKGGQLVDEIHGKQSTKTYAAAIRTWQSES